MQFLKADTNVEVLVGPAVAVGDGFTPVTTLSLSSADEAEVIKNNGATPLVVTSVSANGFAAITSADGYYTMDLTTGNLDTEGPLTIIINDDSLILPIRLDFMVVSANVYDALFAASGTDLLDISLVQVAGATTNVSTIATSVNAIEVDTQTTIPATITTAQADLDTITGASGVILLTATQASIDAIEADTNELQVDDIPGKLVTLDAVVDTVKVDTAAIKAKTDSLAFTEAGYVDANTLKINGASLVGDGNGTPWDGA